MRGVDRFELKPLSGTERATSGCFWSPDNQSVLFYNGTHFRLVDTVSGAARDVVVELADRWPRPAAVGNDMNTG